MRKTKKLFLVFAIGLLLGLILYASIDHFAQEKTCPSKLCVDEAQVIPVFNREYYPHVRKVLSNANESIHMAVFELKYYRQYPESNENRIIEEIIKAENRGVDVKILVDEYSTKNNAYSYLKSKGVEIKNDSEQVTTHSKLVIVDNKIVMVGSTNFSYYGLDKNNEANVLIKSREIAEKYERYFKSLWNA